METKPALIITPAREVVVDARWGGRVGVSGTVTTRSDVVRGPRAGPSGPEPKLGEDAEDGADAELQDHRGAQGGEDHLVSASCCGWMDAGAGCEAAAYIVRPDCESAEHAQVSVYMQGKRN